MDNTYMIRASHSKKFSSFTGPVGKKWVSLIHYLIIKINLLIYYTDKNDVSKSVIKIVLYKQVNGAVQ